ncbi:MAG: fumarylacetoacetase [Pseudomonadota bacterium]|nr:fumarylacetoacetase [Pseudomonadota bacterium]
MHLINETHDPDLRSWVASANDPGGDFPIQNLPFGVFRRRGSAEPWRGGVAIGDQILDLAAAARFFSGAAGLAAAACAGPTLNAFMALGPEAWSALRLALSRALRQGADADALRPCLTPQAQAGHALPAAIGDYTDFYASIHHATNVGRLLRPDNPLLPNYKWMPIAYHGRASTIGVSGRDFPRPSGQTLDSAQTPTLGPSRRLDYELEMGIYIGVGNPPGRPIAIGQAPRHVFGLCLLNDWSARDIQAWEYQPLGPFLAKSFATTVSPWIVTLEALAPYRCPWERPPEDPQPLAYLDSPEIRAQGAIDICLEAWLETMAMRRAGDAPVRLSHSSFRHAYWSLFQMVAHHTVNGCALAPGDLLGSGTMSGPAPEAVGSLLELTLGGRQPVRLPNGETRRFLEDGDAVTLRGWCEKPGRVRIGFGDCRAAVLPAIP